MNLDRLYAGLALDLAAPLELALAPLFERRLHGVISSTAAQQIAAVKVMRGPVADSTLCTQGPDS